MKNKITLVGSALFMWMIMQLTGCASDRFAQYRLGSGSIDDVQKKYGRINDRILGDKAVDNEENMGLLEATAKDLEALKGEERFKGEDYQKALNAIGTNLTALTNEFGNNAEAGSYAVTSTFFKPLGDEKDDVRARGYSSDDGFNFDTKKAEVQKQLLYVAGVTDADITAKNDKYKKAAEVIDALLIRVNEKASKGFTPINHKSQLEANSVPLYNEQAEKLVEIFCDEHLKQQWNANDGKHIDGRFTRESGKSRLRAYDAKVNLGDRVNNFQYKAQKVPGRTGK